MRFADFAAGAEACARSSQSGLHPSNCRLIDAREAALTMAGDGTPALLVLGFESADHPVDARAGARAGDLRASTAASAERAERLGGGGAVGAWRERVPRARRTCATRSSRWACSRRRSRRRSRGSASPRFHERVTAAAREALREACGEGGRVTCRFTHVYPDGPAPYFTVLAPARRGEEVEQWGAIKARGRPTR